MPITDYSFSDRTFFARESGNLTLDEAAEWAKRLREHASASERPIVALVDALTVQRIPAGVAAIFQKASYTENLIAVVVATNAASAGDSSTIGLLGKRRTTWVFKSMEEARSYANLLLADTAD